MKNPKSKTQWLTRNVIAIGMLSLFSDMGHELTTAVLPLFLASFGGGAAALGIIEGVSDAASGLLKLWMSHTSDKIGRRKPILVIGYVVTALMGTFAFVTAWWQMLVIRTAAWMGRGARGPLRDALLSESVPATAHGRAFGFEGAMDTVGAIIGPLIAFSLLGVITLRHIFLLAFLPGAVTVLIVVFVLQDRPRTPQPGLRMWTSLRALPSPYRRYLFAVGLFGLGNFAHTLLILHAVTILTPHYGTVAAGRIGIGLYIFHNVLYAAVSYPAGALGDRISKMKLLAVGYALFGGMCLGFMWVGDRLRGLTVLFAVAGIYIGMVDAMQRAFAADLLPPAQRNMGYGALATVNSLGDLLSSLIVGLLWSRRLGHGVGFTYAAILTLSGAAALFFVRSDPEPTPG